MYRIYAQKRAWRALLFGSLLLFCSAFTASAQSFASKMEAAGLVNVQQLDSTIVVKLIYATPHNFTQQILYEPGFNAAYLLPHIAQKLAKAQQILKTEKGDHYSLIIYDAARPLSVQKKMFAAVQGTPHAAYVSSGTKGKGRHTYGAAVDLSIINTRTKQPLPMGSSVDHFGPEAHIAATAQQIGATAYQNRQYLFQLMKQVGLRPIRKEWWHFQEYESIAEVQRKYQQLRF